MPPNSSTMQKQDGLAITELRNAVADIKRLGPENLSKPAAVNNRFSWVLAWSLP